MTIQNLDFTLSRRRGETITDFAERQRARRLDLERDDMAADRRATEQSLINMNGVLNAIYGSDDQ